MTVAVGATNLLHQPLLKTVAIAPLKEVVAYTVGDAYGTKGQFSRGIHKEVEELRGRLKEHRATVDQGFTPKVQEAKCHTSLLAPSLVHARAVVKLPGAECGCCLTHQRPGGPIEERAKGGGIQGDEWTTRHILWRGRAEMMHPPRSHCSMFGPPSRKSAMGC